MIKLTKENWRQELDQAKAPVILKWIVGAHVDDSVIFVASSYDIKNAWQATQGELEFDGIPYSIVVYVPDNAETHRRFFTLVKKYPGGKLTSLGDVVSMSNLKEIEGLFSGIRLDVTSQSKAVAQKDRA